MRLNERVLASWVGTSIGTVASWFIVDVGLWDLVWWMGGATTIAVWNVLDLEAGDQ